MNFVCENPVKIFGIKNKGFIKEGYDAEEGIEARIAAADADAAQIAEDDVKELLNIQGDINNFEQKTKSVIEITTNTDIEN